MNRPCRSLTSALFEPACMDALVDIFCRIYRFVRREKPSAGSTWLCDHMVRTRRKRPSTSSACHFSREQRRALKKLADSPRGLTEHFLLAHGFSAEMLSGLVLAKLATVVTEPMKAGRGVTIMVERICITDAGRMGLEG
jgi:hypothetical protein